MEVCWAFNTQDWCPTKPQLTRCLSVLPKPEVQFLFEEKQHKKHFKNSLMLRLMRRKSTSLMLKGVKWGDIYFHTHNRKPKLAKPTPRLNGGDGANGVRYYPSFNGSHKGKYTVFTASTLHKVGIDIVSFHEQQNWQPRWNRWRNGQTNSLNTSYFEWYKLKCVKHWLAQSEWDFLHTFVDDEETQRQLCYRFWSLKESFLKVQGFTSNQAWGVTPRQFRQLNFTIKTLLSEDGVQVCADTCLFIEQADGTFKEILDHRFTEYLIDNEHLMVVTHKCRSSFNNLMVHQLHYPNLDYLLDLSQPIYGKKTQNAPQDDWWDKYLRLSESHH